MSYTNGLDKPSDYFNTKLYTGNGSTQSITGVGFQPDWVWIKRRNASSNHILTDVVRGNTKWLESNGTNAEQTGTDRITSFDSDGFGLGSNANVNANTGTFTSWNWLAGGTAPSITYNVKVVSDSGNKYRFDDFGTSAVTLDLQEGGTYTFDQSDSSNSGHPLRFSTTSDGTHGGGSEYTTNVSTIGTAGSAGAKTVITVAASAPTLYYYCTQHSGMGGQANTNSTFGSSNFSGSIQSTVSANISAGFSIVSYTATGSAGTLGHGLSAVPKMIILKERVGTENWMVYHAGNTSAPETDYLLLNSTSATADFPVWNDTAPTSSVFSIGTDSSTSTSGDTYIVYCFAEKKGYSSFGTYQGNGNADGTFVYTGFKPAWFMIKRTNNTSDWHIQDNKRDTFNPVDTSLFANTTDTDTTSSTYDTDFLSNGFKLRGTTTARNDAGSPYIYIAFAESPFVNSNGVPNNAR